MNRQTQALWLAASMASIIAARTPGVLHGTDAADGSAAGRADIVLERAGVQAAFQQHLAGADHCLGSQLIGQLTGHAMIDSAVCQTLHDEVDEGRPQPVRVEAPFISFWGTTRY